METQTRDDVRNLWGYVDAVRPDIERALEQHLPYAPMPVGKLFNDALEYALFPGGKRLRPVLTLLSAELVGAERAAVLRAATAVEYVHTSSLIFDDLPCMDNAQQRRGREALHLRYGEGLAVLVAVALLNTSYGLVFGSLREGVNASRAIEAHGELVACIGTQGMVTGQTVDLSDGGGRDEWDAVRNLKTSALMRLALRLGAILSGAEARQLTALSLFSELLGEAYQISDDVLDEAEDAALAVGGARCATLTVACGPGRTRLRVRSLVAQAKRLVDAEFGRSGPAMMLCEMADYIAERGGVAAAT